MIPVALMSVDSTELGPSVVRNIHSSEQCKTRKAFEVEDILGRYTVGLHRKT